MQHDHNQAQIDKYVASLKEMPHGKLLDELESCVRQNHYGSHDAQTILVRKEIHSRMMRW